MKGLTIARHTAASVWASCIENPHFTVTNSLQVNRADRLLRCKIPGIELIGNYRETLWWSVGRECIQRANWHHFSFSILAHFGVFARRLVLAKQGVQKA
jgi:hypothetical protein